MENGKKKKFYYTPEDLPGFDYKRDLGNPGEFPFARGIHETMYVGRPWTIRQFAGSGLAEETNEIFLEILKDLLGQESIDPSEQESVGLSVAVDGPTLYGYDSDHPRARADIGRGGVAISTIEDMEIIFRNIPLDKITVSITINAPAAILLAMLIVVAKRRGIPPEKLGVTIQNDMLKEYIAQKEWIFPPEPSMRLIGDTIEYGTKYMPHLNNPSISGYHIRETRSGAVLELALTLADGIEYVKFCIARGMDIDTFGPRLSFFFDIHNDIFEEAAKIRAARRMWAKIMRYKFGAKDPRSWDPRSWKLRTHVQTAGCTLTDREPLEANIIRATIQTLTAVLAGAQSIHTNSYDEQCCLPSKKARKIARLTQQIILHETNLGKVVDPLGGSFYLEFLANKLEEGAWKYIEKIEEMGGMLEAIRRGYPQLEIRRHSLEEQKEFESGKKIIVGVNKFVTKDSPRAIPQFRLNPESIKTQLERLARFKAERDLAKVSAALENLKSAARGSDNLMPFVIEAVESHATLGEICQALADVFGRYREATII